MSPIIADKAALRRTLRAERDAYVAALGPERATLEGVVAERLRPLVEGQADVASYAAVGSEFDPFAIEKLLASELCPRVAGDALVFHRAPYASLKPGVLGIPEPAASAPVAQPHILLVPLLAADLAGNRLGQGKGYYDRALARLRGRGPVLAIGLAWEVQLVERLPAEPHDQRLDLLATPGRLLDFRAAA